MSLLKYFFRSIWYYKKQHFAVFFGTVISTAILCGALIIGDSVKYSLKHLVVKRLGNTIFAMETGDRFVTDKLAEKLAESLQVNAASLFQLEGIAINPETSERINSTQILGIDENFWSLSGVEFMDLGDDVAAISSNLSKNLGLNVGDWLLVRVKKVDFIPDNAPFVEEGESAIAFRLKIISVVDNENMGRFSLRNNQMAPYNIFVSRTFLSKKNELFGFVNVVLLSDNDRKTLNTKIINQELKKYWTLDDAGLIVNEYSPGKYEVRSKRIFIEPVLAQSLNNINTDKNEILSYFVNEIKSKSGSTPYSFVTALSDIDSSLGVDEIIINEWLADDLHVKERDSVTLEYYIIGPLRKLFIEKKSFIIKRIIKNRGDGIDQTLMPPFPGLADASSCSDWETGVPVDLGKIRDKDEYYWNKYKGTPKAIISYKTAKSIWGNRFGEHTALRFDQTNIGIEDFKTKILEQIDPQELNLVFLPVREIGELAVDNSIGFGELFMSLSFFVIVSGILLTALLHSLGMESRKKEYGVLAAYGFSKAKIIKIQIFESFFVTFLGALAGVGLGILYNKALMYGIYSIWNDIVRTNELQIYLFPRTLLFGAVCGMITAMLVICLVSLKKFKSPIVVLMKQTVPITTIPKRKRLVYRIIVLLSFVSLIIILISSISGNVDIKPTSFLIGGGLFLIASFALVRTYFSIVFNKKYLIGFRKFSLVLKNLVLNSNRSMTVIILLSLGSYTILITGANHRTFYGLEQNAQSGTGGYLYWIESTLPILYDLNTSDQILNEKDSKQFENIKFMQFYQLEGDDASCLNLNQINQPIVLGVDNQVFDKINAFSFTKLHKNLGKEHPWLALDKELGENIIPAFADQSVITWGLKKNIGDTLYYMTGEGKTISMVLMGGLNNSIFQGNLLISKQYFTKYFPSITGSKVILVDAPIEQEINIRAYLSENFLDFGIEIIKATERLAEFYSVSNTYLTVFMILGGLGVLIGTIGLGVVLLRNLLDRKYETAILQAVGFTRKKIFSIIFLEHFILLITGMFIGLISAIIGIFPSLVSHSFEIHRIFLSSLLIIIFLNGIAWIYFSSRHIMKFSTISVLQSE